MKVVEEFNGLNDAVVSRAALLDLAERAENAEQYRMAERIRTAIKDDKSKEFEVNLSTFELEQLPDYFLNYLDCEETPEEKFTGLNKAVSSDDIYKMITNRMIGMIEEATGEGGDKTWKDIASSNFEDPGYLIPFNFDSKKQYRGINVSLLTEFGTQNLSNPFFMTFKQIEKNKGKLKKGSKGQKVVYFTKLYNYTQDEPKLDFGTYDKKRFVDWFKKNVNRINNYKLADIEQFIFSHTVPILKYYNVFNGEDIEGIDFDLDNFKVGWHPGDSATIATDNKRIEIADAIIKNYPKPAPKLIHKGNRAGYRHGGSIDEILMPPFRSFDSGLDYYRVLLHEFTHSTGAPFRLDRAMGNKFGSKKYAFEELIAEFGAVFLSAHAGIIWRTNMNHADYIKNWSGALPHLQKDNRFLMRAASKAQAAADFVLNLDKEGQPAYFNKIENAKPKEPEAAPVKEIKNRPQKPKKSFKNPKGYSVKPVSTSDKKAIKDILSTEKYDLKFRESQILWKYFKLATKKEYEKEILEPVEIVDPKEHKALKGEFNNYYAYFDYEPGDPGSDLGQLDLGPKGLDFIVSVRHRVESLRNQNDNYSLFPGLSGTPPKKVTLKDTREWAESKLIDRYIYQRDIGERVYFTKKGVKKTIYGKGRPSNLRMKLLYQAPDLIKKARLISQEKDNRGRNEIVGAYRLKTTTVIDGQRYDVSILLREDKEVGIVYYYHGGTKIKKQLSRDRATDNNPSRVVDTKPLSKDKDKKKSKTKPKNRNNGKKGLKNPPLIAPDAPHGTPPAKKPDKNMIPSGFTMASEGTKQKADTFRLKGEMGKFLGDLQRFRLAILLQGDPHAGKSEMCGQLANAFLDYGFSGAYFDLEQGGLSSKDTQASFDRNITAANQKKLAVTGEAPEGINSVRAVANDFDFIVIDSFQELNAPVTAFNDLRKDYPNTIWIIIFQQNAQGGTRGGIKSAYDTPIRLKVYLVDKTFVNNYAEVEKNRGNQIGIRYNVSQMKVINEEQDDNTGQQPQENERPAENSTGRLIIYE